MLKHRWLRGVAFLGGLAIGVASAAEPSVHTARVLDRPVAKALAAQPPTHPGVPTQLDKLVLSEGVSDARSEFTMSADGRRAYFAVGREYEVFDDNGDLVARMPQNTLTRTLIPLASGRFVSALGHAGGHVALLAPDGTELRALVTRGATPQKLRPDNTGWSSPTGLAFDAVHQQLFVLDTTLAPAGTPDPNWSRIAVFDANGQYLREIAAYDGSKSAATDEHRTWYDDIEVDATRSVLYVTAHASQQLWAFDYSGVLRGRAPGLAGIAVLPNGNVAVCDPDRRHVRIYDAELHVQKTLEAAGVFDLESDAKGRLYASVQDASVLLMRWPATLTEPKLIRPRFQRISVGMFDSVTAGSAFSVPVSIAGRPTPTGDTWRVFARPSDGSDLTWKELDSTYALGTLNVRPAPGFLGLNDVAVRYGTGPIDRVAGERDLHVERTVRFESASDNLRLAVRSVSGRSGFQRGEVIPIRVEAHGSSGDGPATLSLQRAGTTLLAAQIAATSGFWQLPAAITRRLVPGHYVLAAIIGETAADPYEFDLAEAEPASPMQRILYHEFDQNPPSVAQTGMLGVAERLAFQRDYLESLRGLGFTRETDRTAARLLDWKAAGAWRVDTTSDAVAHDQVPQGGFWEPESYLDRATAVGIHYDSQILAHCASVRLASSWLAPMDAGLQRLSQWFGKYPSFYGFNYNDELFFPAPASTGSLSPDQAWLNAKAAELAGHPWPDVLRAGLSRMYGEFDTAINEVRPDLGRTTTPMWQYPAVEGSYVPTIYAHMTESYSHYLSEGYGFPWYPAHSAEVLHRPGLPVMGVFDNAYGTGDGESYMKDALQVLGRGVQGFGTEHTRAFADARGSNALRLMNELGEAYGSILAEAAPDNDASVLYSYTQDVAEKRHGLGTPHWERVLALFGAGLMAGLPMSISYEEDVARGLLLDQGKPKARLLFLVGQTTELPAAVLAALHAFTAAGGRVIIDADSRAFPGTDRFSASLMGPAVGTYDALDTDALFPAAQPAYESIAAALKHEFGTTRAFPVDTDDPWVSKNRFAGGAIHYVLVASETSPYPWDAGKVWGLGARFNKSSWPKQVKLSVPYTPVIYDVFERQMVNAMTSGTSSVIPVDLRTFPGRLYALAPRKMAAPLLRASMRAGSLEYSVKMGLPARVPLRIVLRDAHGPVSTQFRSTDLSGEFKRTIARPLGPGPWQLEVSELLGGASSSLGIPATAAPQSWVNAPPAVDTEREPLIRGLLGQPGRAIHLVGAIDALPSDLRALLEQTLKSKAVRFTLDTKPAVPAVAETYLALTTMAGKGPDEWVQIANGAGLFGRKLTERYPGTGRGFVSVAFAPRSYGENVLAVVGGDRDGLELATRRFIALLNEKEPAVSAGTQGQDGPTTISVTGSATGAVDIPKLSQRVGVRLSAIRAVHGKLVLAANGYLANLVRVDDEGTSGRIVKVARIGEAPNNGSLFVSNNGTFFGLSARTTRRFGEAFSLTGTGSAARQDFTSFGDTAPLAHTFSASADGNTVLAPGPYGVVAWSRSASGWREAWSVDYWKQFDQLDWPIAEDAARIPSFDTVIPPNGDVGLIAFGEITDNGWLANQALSSAEVSARSLKDGRVRWTFKAPVKGALLFPKLYANSDGSLLVLQVRIGASGSTFRYYALDNGRQGGAWSSDDAPIAVDVSDRTQRVATAYGNGSRLLEIRQADGSVVLSKTWHSQPLAVSFAEDGASLYVSDDAGLLSRMDPHGNLTWQVRLGCSAELARTDAGLYTAGWDGRVRAFNADGRARWTLDLTDPMANFPIEPSTSLTAVVHEPERSSSASSVAPTGPNYVRSGRATLRVGGTPGWKSTGKATISADELSNGVLDDAVAPWIPTRDMLADGAFSRKVWVEVNFKQPTTVHSLTVYENPKLPDSWPTESLIQVWDDASGHWRTAKHGVFLRGSVATYALHLERVTKLRYAPWSDYFRNFHTSEIEVR